MIEKFAIGIDIVDVNRFSSKKYSENKEFYSKIFTKNEINYCTKFKNPYTHFADKFALKEAVIKAIKKKIGENIDLDIALDEAKELVEKFIHEENE